MINKFHRQLITLLVILLLGTIIVSACGGREAPESTALPAPSSTPVPSSTPEPTYEDVVITLRRGGCYDDACPEYRLAITGNGTVIYVEYARVGLVYYEIVDAHTTTISLEQVDELISEFERVDFFSLNDDYTGGHAPNMVTPKISITIDGRTKTAYYFSSRNSDVPKELFELENKIDEIVNVNQWVEKP